MTVRDDGIVDAGEHPLVRKRLSCVGAFVGKEGTQLGHRARRGQMNLPFSAQEVCQFAVRSYLHILALLETSAATARDFGRTAAQVNTPGTNHSAGRCVAS